jgi:hypothetical protein
MQPIGSRALGAQRIVREAAEIRGQERRSNDHGVTGRWIYFAANDRRSSDSLYIGSVTFIR